MSIHAVKLSPAAPSATIAPRQIVYSMHPLRHTLLTCVCDVPEPALLWCDLLLPVLLLKAGHTDVDVRVPAAIHTQLVFVRRDAMLGVSSICNSICNSDKLWHQQQENCSPKQSCPQACQAGPCSTPASKFFFCSACHVGGYQCACCGLLSMLTLKTTHLLWPHNCCHHRCAVSCRPCTKPKHERA